jgi:hypothetical protein
VTRFPIIAFATLVAATVAAFFVTQHLKVTTPLIAGAPAPFPAAINPISGSTCVVTGPKGVQEYVSFRRMTVSFYLLHRADDVDVYIVDQNGAIVSTLASNRHMAIRHRTVFTWDGREAGGAFARDGTYYIRVSLIHQGRSVLISSNSGPEAVTVLTVRPTPRVTRVAPAQIPRSTGATAVTIHYTGSENRGGTVVLYRTDLPGGQRRVNGFGFPSPWHGKQAVWNGSIGGRPAPQGVYLVGFDLTDKACNTGNFPARLPVLPGATPGAGITVRYLAAQPPLNPVPAGSFANVTVYALGHPYRWTLTRAGAPGRPVASGTGSAASLQVPVPGGGAGLYELALHAGGHTTVVPIVAGAPAAAPPARVLVVLPALTWQGENPGDEDGDGVPDTLDDGVAVALARPLLHGLPGGFADEAGLLGYLDRAHLPYDLTTDLSVIDGSGPRLAGHRGVVLAGTERWLPASERAALRAYAASGGRVLSLGAGSLQRGVTVTGQRALDPGAATAVDALGARLGALVTGNTRALSVISDAIGLFAGAASGLPVYPSYQPVQPAGGAAHVLSAAGVVSAAGVPSGAPAIVAYRLGGGVVIDMPVPGFGAGLGRSAGARALVRNAWGVLGG